MVDGRKQDTQRNPAAKITPEHPTSVEKVDFKSLEYAEGTLHEQLLCPICCYVLSDPCSTSCGHTFCKECIHSALEMAKSQESVFKCPIDRHPLPGRTDILPAPFLVSSLLNDLRVYCPNSSRGCKHQGEKWSIQSHVADDCEYAMVECGGPITKDDEDEDKEDQNSVIAGDDNVIMEQKKQEIEDGIMDKTTETDGCAMMEKESTCSSTGAISDDAENIEQQNRKLKPTASDSDRDDKTKTQSSKNNLNHTQSQSRICRNLVQRRQKQQGVCVHVHIKCPQKCGKIMPAYQLNQHLDFDCMNIMIKCSDCHKDLPRPQLEQHSDTCPEALIFCSADKFGCIWTGKRVEFEKHSNSCQFVQLLPVLTKQDNRMEAVERENKALRYHIERLMNRSSLISAITSSLPSSSGDDDGNDSVIDHSANHEGTSQFTDSDLLHMFMECERLRRDVDRLGTTLADLEVKQGMMIMRENCRTGEEIANLRSGFNGLRHQLHFLLAERRNWKISSDSASGTSSSSAGGVSGVSGTNGSSDLANVRGPQPPVRRLSDLIRDVKL